MNHSWVRHHPENNLMYCELCGLGNVDAPECRGAKVFEIRKEVLMMGIKRGKKKNGKT